MIVEAADKHIPKKGRKKGPVWISQDTLRVVARRRQMKVGGSEKAEWRGTKKN